MSAIDKYIENKDFVSWVLGDKSHHDHWINYIKNNPKEEAVINEAKEWVLQVKIKEPHLSNQKEKELWNTIAKQIRVNDALPSSKEPKTIQFNNTWWRYGAAIVILGLIFIFYQRNFVPDHHVEVAKKGFTHDVLLPDGSTVNLNAESTISYDQESFNAGRYISLKGEAFFNVEKGNLFQVNTEMGTVTVLGTSFNIFARNQRWVVSCYTGKVEVKDKNGQKVVLTKGQEVEYKNGVLLISDHYDSKPNWQKGLFKYTNASLETVFEEIQRQFDIRIIYKSKDIQEMRFSGTFSNASLEKSLQIISKSMGIKYEINKKKKEVEISY